MKTSNKILIGLLGTIFLLINAAIVDIKIFGVHRSNYRIVQHEENYQLKNFKHICIEDKRKIKVHPSILIKSSNMNLIKYEVYADTMIIGFKHAIIGDTLKITSLLDKPFMHQITIHSKHNIESISVVGTDVDFNGFKQDNISLFVKDGEINSWGNDSTMASALKKLRIDQINSKTNLRNVNIDTLEINLKNSKATFYKDILVLNADIKEQSNLHLRNVNEAKFQKDEKSRVYFY